VFNSRAAVTRIKRKTTGLCVFPYVKGVSEKFECNGNRYNIRMIFKTKHTLRSENQARKRFAAEGTVRLNVAEATLVTQAEP
jgi:hypothetical protein